MRCGEAHEPITCRLDDVLANEAGPIFCRPACGSSSALGNIGYLRRGIVVFRHRLYEETLRTAEAIIQWCAYRLVKGEQRVGFSNQNIAALDNARSTLLGGTESLVKYPLVQTHGSIPGPMLDKLGINERLLRLSVGLENAEDLIADLEQAIG